MAEAGECVGGGGAVCGADNGVVRGLGEGRVGRLEHEGPAGLSDHAAEELIVAAGVSGCVVAYGSCGTLC